MTNFENSLYEIKSHLQNMVADYLDVNRNHIKICYVDTELIGEDLYDWDNNEFDACEGTQTETYYSFAYQYREDAKTLDYGELQNMVWQHIESENYTTGFTDKVMTYEDFETLFEKKKTDPCSVEWFESVEIKTNNNYAS